MPRCSETALETALRQLSEHAASGRARANWMSTYLVAQRMSAAGYPMTINGANSGVADVFVLLPDNPHGRSNPFVDLGSDYRWGQVEASGRKTVWNTGTRNGAQRILFNQDHFSNGLLPNAIDALLTNLGAQEPLPARDALAVLLTRDQSWPTEPTRDELLLAAADFLGISVADFERITDDVDLGVPILGAPEWSAHLLEASELGPPSDDHQNGLASQPGEEIPIESIEELPEQFRRFLAQYGIATGGDSELLDLLAATLSSQFVIMAGPSGSGKSLIASALAAFFAPPSRRARLDSSRLLAKPQEFFGFYSQLAAGKFIANEPLLTLLELDRRNAATPPMITIEEANLSPIEGYLSPLVHGFGALETASLPIRLHTQAESVESQLESMLVPPILDLAPYPRIFATLNVDAESPAPARKVVSRGCVVLLETPEFDTALVAAGALAHPSVEDATGPAAALIGRPTIALHRYIASGSNVFEQALSERATMLRDKLGVDVIAHRQLQRSLMYMAWFVELSGETDADQGQPAVEAAADNATLHFVLPSLPAAQFEKALEALDDGNRTGVLAHRLSRLRGILAEYQFGPPPDFWGALS
jgi:hypothetical protein